MFDEIREVYNSILNSLKLTLTPNGLEVDSTQAGNIISEVDFVILPQLIGCAAKAKPQVSDYLKLSRECKTMEELNLECEKLNIRSVAATKIPKLVDAELAKRSKPIGNKKRV